MKKIHEIIDEFYPTINHVELGELYCKDKVVLIVRDYMAQFEQLQQADVSGSFCTCGTKCKWTLRDLRKEIRCDAK